MIDLYYWPTPNGWKVSIMLEECGLPYTVKEVDIGGGDQFTVDFLRISPNNRMPAIVDNAPLDGGEPLSVFESGAILEYLADKTGKFLPTAPRRRSEVLQWVHWQMANLGPMMGNANHFKNYAKNIADDPSKLEYGIKRFVGEVDRLAAVMDAQLSANQYLAGAEYTIADIITWPWAFLIGRLLENEEWTGLSNLKRWADEVGAREAVQKGFRVGREMSKREYTPEEEKERRDRLFNQDAAKVQAAREEAARRK